MATIITNTGKEVVTGRFLTAAPALSLYVGWGTGAGTAAVADTTLFTEAAEGRTAAVVTQAQTTTLNDTIQAVGTLTASANRSVTNVGLFDALTSGNLIMKGDFTAMALNANDSITFTLKIQFT